MALNIVEARLASVFPEGILFGIYLVSFFYTVRALILKRSRHMRLSAINNPLAIVVILMFCNAALNSATSIVISWKAWILTPPGGAEESFRQITNWAIITKSAVLLSQTTIGDGMLIYRCWILYDRSLLPVALSIILWFGGTACTIATIYFESISKEHALADTKTLYPFSVSFWASTIVLNIITTTLIVLPIWKASHNAEKFGFQAVSSGTNRMRFIMHVIIESGLLYTMVAFMTFVTYTTKSNALYIMSNSLVPIAGIAFNLIIIRTSREEQEGTSNRSGTLSTFSAAHPAVRLYTIGNCRFKNVENTQNDQIHVTVSQSTRRDSSSRTHADYLHHNSSDVKTMRAIAAY